MSDIDVKVKMAAYERGILPQKMSQLENDVGYVDADWVEDNFLKKGQAGFRIDCGDVKNRFKET